MGCCAFARHYLRNHCYFLFLRVLRCFSSPGSPTGCCRCGGIAPAGFPHSDIRGSQGICPSPRLFAACHVLLRLREPQASPMRPFFLSLFLQARRNATTQGGAPLPYTKRPPSFRMTICSLYVARSRVLTPLLAARTRSLAAAQGGGRRRGNTAGAEQDRSIYIASFSRPAFGSN